MNMFVYQIVIIDNGKEYVMETRNAIDNILLNGIYFYKSHLYQVEVRKYKVTKKGISTKYVVVDL